MILDCLSDGYMEGCTLLFCLPLGVMRGILGYFANDDYSPYLFTSFA